MPYYAYMAGFCQHCGKDMGMIDQIGGRNRKYCNDSCKIAAFRKREKERNREQVLQYNSILRDYWQEAGITGDVLTRLQDILVEYGKDAARCATDTVLIAIRQIRNEGEISSPQGQLCQGINSICERINHDISRNPHQGQSKV